MSATGCCGAAPSTDGAPRSTKAAPAPCAALRNAALRPRAAAWRRACPPACTCGLQRPCGPRSPWTTWRAQPSRLPPASSEAAAASRPAAWRAPGCARGPWRAATRRTSTRLSRTCMARRGGERGAGTTQGAEAGRRAGDRARTGPGRQETRSA
ncbi:hypothetical protein AAY473_033151 [Plecturocebus cupreus]